MLSNKQQEVTIKKKKYRMATTAKRFKVTWPNKTITSSH